MTSAAAQQSSLLVRATTLAPGMTGLRQPGVNRRNVSVTRWRDLAGWSCVGSRKGFCDIIRSQSDRTAYSAVVSKSRGDTPQEFSTGPGIVREGVSVTDAAVKTQTANRPIALFVLGMGRSGTSALTRVLSLCGGTLPTALAGANSANPRGYWEPRKAIHLNAAILRRHGSANYDPSLRLEEEGAFTAEAEASYIAKIRAYLTTLPAVPLVVIKDLQIAALSGIWFEATRQAGFDIAIVHAVRHPNEVIASSSVAARVTPELASALWLKTNLLAEKHTRGLPRVFVEYPNLLDDWRREVKRISAALPIDLTNRDESAIDEFLTNDLHRQRHCSSVTETFGTDWISTVYEALSAAARDEPLDETALDGVFNAYKASAHGFSTAFEDYRGLRKRVGLMPTGLKLINEALAIAHLRRGPWA